MKRIKTLGIIILLFCGISNLFSQMRTITGTIYDADTNLPLKALTVSLQDTLVRITTDQSGKFSFQVPEKMSNIAFANFPGMKTKEMRIIDANTYNIFLSPIVDIENLTLEELMQIDVTTASKRVEKANTAPATIYVITENDIITNGYKDLIEILENTPGVVPIKTDMFAFGGQRGFLSNFSQSLLLINGREMQNLIASETFISNQFATHNIKQVEILQGPGSALYGANAMVGVINIITKDCSTSYNKVEYQSEIGTQNTLAHSIVFGTGAGDFHIGGSFRFYQSELWDYTKFVNDTVNFREGYRNNAFSKNLAYQNQNQSMPYTIQLDYKGFYVGSQGFQLVGKKGLENVALDYLSQSDTRQLQMSYAGFNKNINQDISINTEIQYYNEKLFGNQYGYNYTQDSTLLANGHSATQAYNSAEIVNNFTDVYTQEASSGSKRYRANVQLNYLSKTNLSVIAGYTFDMNDILGIAKSNSTLTPSFDETRSETNSMRKPYYRQVKNSLFAQVQKPFFEKLYATLGGRLDYSDQYKSIFTFRGGLVYQMFEKTSLKLLYGQAFREPNIFELGAFSSITSNLKPTKLDNYELGLNHSFTPNLKFNVVGYQSVATNNIVPYSTLEFVNSTDKQTVYGVESQLFYKLAFFRTDIGYAYSHREDEVYAGQTVKALGIYPHRVNLGLTFDVTKHLVFNTRVNYYSEMSAKHGNPNIKEVLTIPSYSLVNSTITFNDYKIANLNVTAQFIADNVLDGVFYQPNIRTGGPKQFLQHGRQFLFRLIFKI